MINIYTYIYIVIYVVYLFFCVSNSRNYSSTSLGLRVFVLQVILSQVLLAGVLALGRRHREVTNSETCCCPWHF